MLPACRQALSSLCPCLLQNTAPILDEEEEEEEDFIKHKTLVKQITQHSNT